MTFFALLFKVFGVYFKRMLRVTFLWVPLGVAIERWSLFERLLDAGVREALAEAYMTLGPILRKLAWLLPVLALYAVAVPVAEARDTGSDNAKIVKDKIRAKMDARGKRHGLSEAEWLAGLQTLPLKPDGRLKTLMSKTEKNSLLRIDITSDRFDLKPIITDSFRHCKWSISTLVHWCTAPDIVIGAQRVKGVKVLDGRAIGQPVYIHPAKLKRESWLNRLTFYARAPVDGGPLTIKTMRNVLKAVPLVHVSITDERTGEDLIAKRRAQVQAEREEAQRQKALAAEKRRKAEEARRREAEAKRQRELAEQRRREEEARKEAERQRQLAEKRRREEMKARKAELKNRARPESAPVLDPERGPLDLSGKWRLKDVGNIIQIDHDAKTGRLRMQSFQFSREHIERDGRSHYTLDFKIDPKTPDKFGGDVIVHLGKEYMAACPAYPGAVRVHASWVIVDAYTLISRQKFIHYTVKGENACTVREGKKWVTWEWSRLSSWGQWWYTDFYSFKFLISLLFVSALVIGAWRLFRRGEAALRAAQAEAQKEEAELINENIKNLSNKLGV